MQARSFRPTSPAGRSTSTASIARCSGAAATSIRSTTCSPCACWCTSISDCYTALGVVHSIWRPIPGQFDDYIANPQGEPVPVAAHDGDGARRPSARDPDPHARDAPGGRVRRRGALALQGRRAIRTRSSTRRSPGCASSWTGSRTSRAGRRSSSTRSRPTSSRTRCTSSRPKGEIKELPSGATPLDFAYRIHTDVGHKCVGAKVNGRLVSLDTS